MGIDEIKHNYSEGHYRQFNTVTKWAGFMRHNYDAVDRFLLYYLISSYVQSRRKDWPLEVAEIGFGDCRDYKVFFRELEARGKIKYTGYETATHFVGFAESRYGERFREGSFLELDVLSYDLAYTRHAFEHVAPHLMEPSLEHLLRASRNMCVISFHLKPDKENFRYGSGSWMNTYDAEKIAEIIAREGFRMASHVLKPMPPIYWLERGK